MRRNPHSEAKQLYGSVAMGITENAPRVAILDPLRGIAALAVTWFHFTNGTGFVKTNWLKASGEYGWLGVEIFFVVSGFVIPYSMYRGGYHPRQHFGRFLGKRLIRLEPPYLVSIALVIALGYMSALSPWFAGTSPQVSLPQVLLHLGYLSPWFGYSWLNPVYWSLGIEFQFYLLIAIVYPLLVDRRAAIRAAAIVAMVATACLVQAPLFVFHYLGLFTLGVLSFQYYAALCPGGVFVVTLIIIAAATALGMNLAIGVVGGLTALTIAFVSVPHYAVLKGAAFLGSISYSVYLLHTIFGTRVINLGSRFHGGIAWEIIVLTMGMVVTVVAAIVFNRLIERPAQHLSSLIKYSLKPRSLDAELCDSDSAIDTDGAGAGVTKDVPAGAKMAGVPARQIGVRESVAQ